MSNSASQGVYSPLPQSISDTDSEEELHSAIPQTKFKDTSNHLNGADLRNYHHLNDADDNNHMNGFPNINTNMLDDSPMIKDGYKKPMTPIRKFFFTLSILVCFLTIVIFLWILPCSEDATCPAVIKKIKISNWEKPYHGIELMGPINVVKGMSGHSKNIVLLFRGDVVNQNPVQGLQKVPPKGGGAISIMGDTGKVAWYVPRQRLPSDIDCSLLDVDGNGNPDCILSGAEGMLEVIDPISGALIWCIHIHNNTNSLITSVDFPVIVSDTDKDHVNDLLTSCSLNNSNHNIIVVVSGRVGNILGKPYIVKNCQSVHNLEVDDSFLSYSCQRGDDFKKMFVSLNDFYKEVLGIFVPHSVLQTQHAKIEKNTDNQRIIYSVNGRQLIVNNQGKCPGSCSVGVQLIDQRNSNQAGNIIYSYNGKNVYGMVPTSMTFKNSENNINSLQGHINGFILKYWQWNDIKTDNSYPKDYFNNYKIMKRNLLDNIYEKKLPWYFPTTRIHRSLPDKVKNISVTEQMLTERVSLITFNSTNFNVVNASQSDVKQLCAHGDKIYCQPDLSFQKNSVLIADLDDDGSKELISYLSTFVISDEYDENNNAKYQLQSSVKVVRLESELPKLYEAVTKY